jgi:SAM-dependent methyltransferase
MPGVDPVQIMEMFYRLEMAVGNAHAGAVRSGDWNYIPLSHLRFYHALKETVEGKDAATLRFLELGCGLGTKLHIAHAWVGIGNVTGIEIVPAFAEIARSMLGDAATILEVNVREFTNFHDYDIIYSFDSYNPLLPEDLMEWMDRVKTAMKPGAVLLQGRFDSSAIPMTSIRTWQKP